MAILSDTDSVIDALGGTYAVSQLFDCRMQRVSNWRLSEVFPPDTFETIANALASKGVSASLSLWRTIPTSQLARMKLIAGEISDKVNGEAPYREPIFPPSSAEIGERKVA